MRKNRCIQPSRELAVGFIAEPIRLRAALGCLSQSTALSTQFLLRSVDILHFHVHEPQCTKPLLGFCSKSSRAAARASRQWTAPVWGAETVRCQRLLGKDAEHRYPAGVGAPAVASKSTYAPSAICGLPPRAPGPPAVLIDELDVVGGKGVLLIDCCFLAETLVNRSNTQTAKCSLIRPPGKLCRPTAGDYPPQLCLLLRRTGAACPNPDRRAPTTNSGRGVLKPRTDCDGLTAERGDCCAPLASDCWASAVVAISSARMPKRTARAVFTAEGLSVAVRDPPEVIKASAAR